MESRKTLLITNLQALRAFAAVGVVFYHTAFVIPGCIHTDFDGVMIFFVMSGFIMTYITRSKDEKFLTSRLIRIVPIYWIATIFVFLFGGLGFTNPTYTFPLWWHFLWTSPAELVRWFSHQTAALFTREAVIHLLTSMLFIPTTEPPFLGVGWTLNIEIFFYVVFWLALKVSRRFAPLIACVTLIVFKLPPLRDIGAWGALYGHGYTWGFIFGVGAYYAWAWFDESNARVSNGAVYAANGVCWFIFLAACLKKWPIPDISLVIGLVFGALATPVVFGALAMHSRGARVSSA